MKNIFPGYYKKTEDEIAKMWQNGLLCFDANVLLNLYRYSNETRNELISLIEKLSDKICLPHQAALEYNRNRYEVIADQEKIYKEFILKLNQIEKDLKSTSKPPFLSKKNHNAMQKVFSNVNSEVEESIDKYCNYLKKDEIFDKVSTVFKGKITKPFSDSEMEDIFKEGVKRYEMKQPPGYEDEKTKKDNRKYGDLILWKQIIQVAKEKKIPIILITDERKEDWWWKIKDGRNMRPRHELVNEIKQEADVDFHMYSSERFMSYGVRYLKEQVNKKVIEELQEMARTERLLISRKKMIMERRLTEQKVLEREGFEKIKLIEDEINHLKDRINSLRHEIEIFKNVPSLKQGIQEQMIEYSIVRQNMEDKLQMLLKEREYLLDKYKREPLKGFGFDGK